MKGVNIFLADGFEDIEALGTRDVLVRGGVSVNLVGIEDEPFSRSSHGLCVAVDSVLSEFASDGSPVSEQDFMIFPGGMPGSSNLANCPGLIRLMNTHYAAGGSLAAICAAPGFVLSKLDGAGELTFTGYDNCVQALTDKGAVFKCLPAVKSGRVITGRGPGHTLDFALMILSGIKGPAVAEKVSAGMTLPCKLQEN